MVDVEFGFQIGFTAALTLIFVTFKNVFFYFWRNDNSGSFRHLGIKKIFLFLAKFAKDVNKV